MPRCLHPGDTDRVVLESDKHLPTDEQPFFMLRALTGRTFRDAARICEKMAAGKDKAGVAAIDDLYTVLKMGVVGWGNMIDRTVDPPVELVYGEVEIEDVVDPVEGSELLNAMFSSATISAEDKKKSASPPSFGKRPSAQVAARNGATSVPTK